MPNPTRILIVDDEPGVVSTLELAFEDSGWDVHSATNGTEALEQLRDGAFDLVLMDKNLPDIDGVTIVGIVRANNPHLKVIMMTGYGSVDSAVEISGLGIEAYIEKPFDDVFEVRALVDNALGYDSNVANRKVGQAMARQSPSFATSMGGSRPSTPLAGDELLDQARSVRLSIVLASRDATQLKQLGDHVRNDMISATQYDLDVAPAPESICKVSDGVFDVAILHGGRNLIDAVADLRTRSPATVVFIVSDALSLDDVKKLIAWQVHHVSTNTIGSEALEKELLRFLRSALALKRAVL